MPPMSMRELLVTAVLVASCGSRTTSAPPPVEPPPSETATPTETGPVASGPSVAEAAGKQPDGGSCAAHEECASGICEGQGCDAKQPGVCAPQQRGCTRDLRKY